LLFTLNPGEVKVRGFWPLTKNQFFLEIEQKIEQLKEEIRSGKLFTLQPPTSNTTSNENTSTDVSETKQSNFNEGLQSSTV